MPKQHSSFELNETLLKYAIKHALAQTKAYSGVAFVYLSLDGSYLWQWTGAPDTARTVCIIKDGYLLKMDRDATPEEVEFINLVIQTEGENTNAQQATA